MSHSPYRLFVMSFLLLGLVAMFASSFQNLMHAGTVKETRSRGNVTMDAGGMPPADGTAQSMGSLPEGDANLAITEQQADDVTQLMRKLQTNPNDADALVRLGEIFIMAEDWARGEMFLGRAMVSRPADPRPRYMLGICQYRQDKIQEAAATFEGLLAVKEEPAVMYNLAVIYKHNLGQEVKARELLHKIIDSPDADADTISKAREELAAQ